MVKDAKEHVSRFDRFAAIAPAAKEPSNGEGHAEVMGVFPLGKEGEQQGLVGSNVAAKLLQEFNPSPPGGDEPGAL
ncbi:MAG: hypothetical protein ACE5HL_02070 [Terriglobia bacterium]